MAEKIETLGAALLEAALAAGADAADVLVSAGRSVSVEVRGGALEQAERSEGRDLGLRVICAGRQACVSASDTSPETFRAMAERAVAMAREAPADATVGLADLSQLSARRDAEGLDLVEEADAPTPEALLEAALTAEAAARDVAGISLVDNTSASHGVSEIALLASNGFAGRYARSAHSLSCVAITGEGSAMERDWAAESRSHRADLPAPDEVGRLAAERALARQGARKPPTGAFPVLFDERVAASLIGHLTAAINGGAIVRGASWLRDAMGEAVLPPGLDLVEDPLRLRGPASRPFDVEGLPVARRALVRDGVLQGWVLDLGTARKLGMESTGNATRGTGGPPSPGLGNLDLSQGRDSREALIAQMGRGLVITSLMGSAINPTTGDYSRGASGFWVEGGQIAWPVNECTIAGNLREMLMRLTPANDARPHAARRVPSLLVEGLTLAGG
ncbi:MAG: TldD/PmbA family protein [Rhodobacteraceae bacterium]|nr:TldD/PmbA family protein [Paracoccaceae bacterium]